MRTILRPILLSLLLVVSTLLAGCSDGFDPCRPRTYADHLPLGVPLDAPATGTEPGGASHSFTVVVHDESPTGDPVSGAGVVIWRTLERTETVSCGEEEERKDTYQNTRPVAYARTGADGIARIEVDQGGTMGLVVGNAVGYLGWAYGDPFASGLDTLHVALLRANKTVEVDNAIRLALPIGVEATQDLLDQAAVATHPLALHDSAAINAQYLSLIKGLHGTLTWTNGATAASTLTLGYRLIPDHTTLAQSPDPTSPSIPQPGEQTLRLDLEEEALLLVQESGVRGGNLEADIDWDDVVWAYTDLPYRLVVGMDFHETPSYAAYPVLPGI